MGWNRFARALERQQPRMPSKSSPCLVEEAGWALGCVTSRDKIQSEKNCFTRHQESYVVFRPLSLGLCRSNVSAFGGGAACENQIQEHVFQEEANMVVQKAASGNLGYVLLNPLSLYAEQEGCSLVHYAVKHENTLQW